MDVGSGVVTSRISLLATRNSSTASEMPAPVSTMMMSAMLSSWTRFWMI